MCAPSFVTSMLSNNRGCHQRIRHDNDVAVVAFKPAVSKINFNEHPCKIVYCYHVTDAKRLGHCDDDARDEVAERGLGCYADHDADNTSACKDRDPDRVEIKNCTNKDHEGDEPDDDVNKADECGVFGLAHPDFLCHHAEVSYEKAANSTSDCI